MRGFFRLGLGMGRRKDEAPNPPKLRKAHRKYILLVRNKKAMFLKLTEEQIRDRAAVRIQAVVRQHLARHLIMERIDLILDLLKARCARIIQRMVRVVQKRKRSREQHHRETKVRLQVTIVQSFVRVWLAKRRVLLMGKERLKNVARSECAIFLQCHYRRREAVRVKEFRAYERQKGIDRILKATVVQKCYRRHMAKKVLVALKGEKLYLDSVMVVQRAVRRYLCELESHKIEVIRRVTLVQCIIRQFLAKMERDQLLRAKWIIQVQSIVRRY